MSKILIIGDYLSRKDEEAGNAFRDGNGRMLKALLTQCGINPRECEYTNVFNFVPTPKVSINSLMGNKTEGVKGLRYYKRGKYLKAEYYSHLKSLWARVLDRKPNLILALGDVALWALTSETSIDAARGRITSGHAGIPNIKVLPTYHPKQINMDYTIRPIIMADLEKAKRQAEFPEIIRPQRFIHTSPSIEDLESFFQTYIKPSPKLDVDIETKGNIITCIGFAPSPERVIVVPFFTEAHKDGNYWRTSREEYLAWAWVKRMLKLGKSICGQNFLYDIQYLWREMGIPVPDFTDDTMLMHHALQPEMKKGLGFLASIYTDELAWKFMHHNHSADRGNKKEDV